uniref:Uncharacterized protein n=1 Tax=Siphoviridae sp. ctnPP24 TaxID=2825662 RepID=A0A8S5TYV1_9CAUD|nr:MAG TPA: hypothetical protein [Siphoviridae sp. ctnPP24]
MRKIVEKHGLKMRTCGQLNKKYSYDKDFFTKQSSNLAYFFRFNGVRWMYCNKFKSHIHRITRF